MNLISHPHCIKNHIENQNLNFHLSLKNHMSKVMYMTKKDPVTLHMIGSTSEVLGIEGTQETVKTENLVTTEAREKDRMSQETENVIENLEKAAETPENSVIETETGIEIEIGTGTKGEKGSGTESGRKTDTETTRRNGTTSGTGTKIDIETGRETDLLVLQGDAQGRGQTHLQGNQRHQLQHLQHQWTLLCWMKSLLKPVRLLFSQAQQMQCEPNLRVHLPVVSCQWHSKRN